MILNETAWGLGNSMLTVILGYTDNSVEMLAANAVMGNLNRLFLVVCFGLGAATAVIIGKSIGEGRSHQEVMDLSRTLLVFTALVGAGLTVLSLLLVPTLFVPVVFPLFKLYGESAAIATALAVTGFLSIPPPRLLYLRRHRRLCGRAATCSGPPCWTWDPSGAWPLPLTAAAGAGAEGGLLVDRRRHPVGEPAEGAAVRPAYPHGTVDPRRHRPKGAWAMSLFVCPICGAALEREPGRYRCPAGHKL